jgi:hypothetical protein
VTGSTQFLIKPSNKFARSYKELLKRYYKGDRAKQTFIEHIAQILENLSNDPFLADSFAESSPGGLLIPEAWEFRKYYFDMPSLRGASEQGRLMYLVNRSQSVIFLVWMYTHSEFEKRPPDKVLRQLIQELVESPIDLDELSSDEIQSNDDV